MTKVDVIQMMADAMENAFVHSPRSATGDERLNRPLTKDEARHLAIQAFRAIGKAGLAVCEIVKAAPDQ